MAFHQITLSQLVQGRIMQNVICVQDPSDAMTQQNIAGRIITDWIPVIKVVQWNQTTWNDITIKQMFVGPTPPTFKQSINIVGTGGTSKSIGWQAWKLRFQTGLAGRTQRGRYFIAGIAQGPIDLTAETIGSTSIPTFNTLVGDLAAKWTGAAPTTQLKLAIAHRDGSTPSLVSTITYDNFLAQMRSRKIGVGI